MRKLSRNAEGFFVPPGSPPNPSITLDTTQKYIRNPETGVYERNPYARPVSPNPYANARPISPETISELNGHLRPIQPSMERIMSPVSPKRTTDSFDDMLRNLDELVQQSTPLDFNGMTDSIDQMMGQGSLDFNGMTNGQSTPERMVSPDRSSRLLSLDRSRSSREHRTRERVLSPERSRRDRIASPNRDRFVSPERLKPQISDLSSSPRAATSPRLENASIPEPKKTEEELAEQERQEMEKQIRELNRVKAEQRAANRREAEMVAQERMKRTQLDRERKQRRGSTSTEFSLIASVPADESLLVSDYVTALMTTLRNDPTISPVPNDFLNPDGFAQWKTTMRRSFQEVLIKMLKYRFLKKPELHRGSVDMIELRFRVLEARGLRSKEGKTPKIYCMIEHGDLNVKSKKRERFETDVVESLDPVWNQSMTIQVKNITDKVNVLVYDRQKSKDYFLGHITIPFSELITECARSSDFEKEYNLEPLEKKEKYVGGTIRIGAFLLDQPQKATAKTYQEIQTMLNTLQVDNNSLFDVMLRACVVLDLFTPRDGRPDLLSPESVSMLKLWARTWSITESYQVLAHLKILFEKYQQDQLSISDLLKAFHYLYATVKHRGPFEEYEVRITNKMEICITLLERMKKYCAERVVKYKELFPQNQPRGALESTILVLRMIHRFPTWREHHPETQESHRDELRIMMYEACMTKFQRFKELAAPLDETDVESVIEAINKLADLINDEIQQDADYFQPAFAQELDIVRLTAECMLKHFVLALEDGGDVLGGDVAVRTASHHVFQLYKTIRLMGERYAKSVPGLSSMSIKYIEGWFAPFMYKWLKQLSSKTVGWVDNAIKADNFNPISPPNDFEVPLHSCSISDVFSAIYSELEFITNLQWSDPVQNAHFLQAFAKTMNAAIEQYCDAIMAEKIKADSSTTSNAVTVLTANFLGSKKDEPQDLQNISFAKLRNVAFAMNKLREVYSMLNVSAITHTVRLHRESMAQLRPNHPADSIAGAFKIHVAYAENIKPALKNGFSNPYVIVRVPEGTLVPPDEAMAVYKKKSRRDSVDSDLPTVLKGLDCELFRSRVVQESLNPTWEETFSVILPPVQRLEVAVFSKNIISADEVCGTAIIDLGIGSRLKRRLFDHQTHDIYIELEPQGRILIRLTMEGEEEDVDYWFRRTNERLIRTRDSLLRFLTEKVTTTNQISAFISQCLQKTVKDNDPAPIVTNSFFDKFTSNVKYSDQTASGKSIHEAATESEAAAALQPLIEYLEKNLEQLCHQLPLTMSEACIQKIWTETLTIMTNLFVPPLFGLHSQKILSRRQYTLLQDCLALLREFMHGDGGEFGLKYELMDDDQYLELKELMRMYSFDPTDLKREFELSMMGGKEKELLLRLIRLKGQDALWLAEQIDKRKEASRGQLQ